ncbi:threonine-phosphate decarboxylase [Gymnodinialimonas sp. 2305UL16-5]|uniref:threonine-phosphate decarboxylase n=1 Tax=Gymnodinialimonas mytili TaxID=3126503 RepID=UPI0030B6A2C1
MITTGPLQKRDHGGGLDAAMQRYGGLREDWVDLSTGINPVAYPFGQVPHTAWTELPDTGAMENLIAAARTFWQVPDTTEIIAAPGVSSLITRIPDLVEEYGAHIPKPTYNEHAAAFAARGRLGNVADPHQPTHVYVHPNNPDGRLWPPSIVGDRQLTIIDESFCDTLQECSHIALTERPGVIVYKGMGKFWGLAGLRLGFAIGQPETLAGLSDLLGPWPVSGPALWIGARALRDSDWAEATRVRLIRDTARLDDLLLSRGAEIVGGTSLFRTYHWPKGCKALHEHLAQRHILTRIFPYSQTWIRFGLPRNEVEWVRLRTAL